MAPAVPVVSAVAVESPLRARDLRAPLLSVLILASAVGVAWWLGRDVRMLRIGATPFKGEWSPEIGPWMLPAVAFGAAAVWAGPRLARRLPWTRLVVGATVAGAVWALLLASGSGGPGEIAAPLSTEWDYLAAVPLVDDPVNFVDGFVGRVPHLPLHVRSHPPGTVLLFWGMDRIGLAGAGWAAAAVLAAAATTVAAVLIALRELGGEDRARRAAPFLVLAPSAVWLATSADALFTAVAAWAVALIVIATGQEDPRRTRRRAWAGGVLAGAALMLSYGVALLALLPVAVVAIRRRWDVGRRALAGAAAVLGLFALAGFWWPSGLEAARDEYWRGVASVRPYGWFLALNLVAGAAAIGPAAAAGIRRIVRSADRTPWTVLPAGALVAIAAANLSGLSKGEVERIWLPFFPWVITAASALPWRQMRPWLAASAGTGAALQLFLRSPW
jgi:hypothetical protein